MSIEPISTVTGPSGLYVALCAHLRGVFECHTAILYGSWASGEANVTSDVDVIGFRDHGGCLRVGAPWRDTFLDLFIHDSDDKPDRDWIRIVGGIVLFQRAGYGDATLRSVQEIVNRGPEPLADNEIAFKRTWAQKMLRRASRGDPEGYYRMHWLLTNLLQDYFEVRARWYLGPKASLSSLLQTNPDHHRILTAALAPDATLAQIEGLVDLVFEAHPA